MSTKKPHLALVALPLFCVLSGCAMTDQVHSNVNHTIISLGPADLESGGIGFITPSSVTGHEADKQDIALVFADVLAEEKPDLRIVPLPKLLSSVNRAGLAEAYKRMYEDYYHTGILDRETLRRVGEVSDVRFAAQLNLVGFEQSSNKRLSVAGIRLFETKLAQVRVFLQIWDTEEGSIAWEGSEELTYAYETTKEKPVTFQYVAAEAARNLFAKIPAAPPEEEARRLSLAAGRN